MIQIIFYNGAAALQYGLQNLTVRVIFTMEVAVIVLGIIIGLFSRIHGKCYIWLLIPGFVGCAILFYVNTLGRTMLSNADIWPPLLAEDLVIFSVISCMALYLKKRCKQKSE